MKKIIVLTLLLLLVTVAQAKTTTQVGLMNDYLFRGLSKTDHGFAAYGKKTTTVGNAYASLYVINIDAPDNAEGLPLQMNMSFGYNNKFDGFNLDVEVITYNYLVDSVADETEFKFGTSLTDNLDFAIYRGIKNKTWYPELTYEKFLSNRLYLDANVGYWLQDDADDSAVTAHAELGRDFPEIYGIDIYVGIDFISDTTPFGYNNDEDESEINYIFGIRKNF